MPERVWEMAKDCGASRVDVVGAAWSCWAKFRDATDRRCCKLQCDAQKLTEMDDGGGKWKAGSGR